MILWSLGLLIFAAELEVNAKIGNQALKGQKLRLVELSQGDAEPVLDVTSSDQGKARFKFNPKNDRAYVVFTLYEGEPYSTEIVPGSKLPQKALVLQVYERTESLEDLSIENVSFAIRSVEGRLEIEESFNVLNSGSKTVASTPGPKAEVLRLRLPKKIFNLRYGQGFDEEHTRVEGNDLIITKSVRPGSHYFSLNYEIDQPRISVEFDRSFSRPVNSVEVFLNEEALKLSGLEFVTTGEKFYSAEMGRVFTAQLKPPATEFSFKVSGLPANIPWTWWLPYVLLAVYLIALMSVKSLKAPQSSLIEQKKRDLLMELKQIQILREKNLMDTREYEHKKLLILEQLVPHYSQDHDRQRSAI